MTSAIEPDTKDWTWVLDRPCPQCGFEASTVSADRFGSTIRDDAAGWEAVLALDDAGVRPDRATWSPLEYACHVRDVHRTFVTRVGLMLDEDGPRFPNWDQDATAVEERYGEQDPAVVSAELREAAAVIAARYESVPPEAWCRRGFRSDGSEFTVESIGRYHLHDIVHHAWDVRAAAARATITAYDRDAAAYAEGTTEMPESVRTAIDAFVAALAPGARVLEIGSGPGRDAGALEDAGLSVRRTDVSHGFVERLRACGHAADVVDPLSDDLADPDRAGTPYDAVWASASLLHVARADLPRVLRRLAEATAPGGLLRVSVKEGDGEVWSTHGHVAAPRRFTLWRAQPLSEVAEGAGWLVQEVVSSVGGTGQRWLDLRARRA